MMRARAIIRRDDLERVTGLSYTTIFRRIKSGDFPSPVQLGDNSIGWFEDEIIKWQKSLERGFVEAGNLKNKRI